MFTDNNTIEKMTNYGNGLPVQKVSKYQKDKDWGKACINYYSNYRYSDGTNLRSTRMAKLINYDLYNGKIHYADVEKICDPLGIESKSWADKFQHYDIVSEPLRLLIGEESKRPDNFMVVSESPTDLSRKSNALKSAVKSAITEQLINKLKAQGQDPQQSPELQKLEKYNNYNIPDLLEIKANRLLKRERKRNNIKEIFSKGWKDALIAGEEIYWIGILNGESVVRRVNPANVSVILDDDTQFVDDAIAVIEERMLSISSIIDEYGDELDSTTLEKLYSYTKGTFGTFNTAGGFEPQFTIDQNNITIGGITPVSNSSYNSVNNESLRVVRVEWMSMKKVGTLRYTDENNQPQEELVDEDLKLNIFKQSYPDATVEWFWINEPWEGVKIGADIYIGIKAKENQRRRMDNPYYSRLGYVGYIYEATNSKSVSLIDRLKSYQYLYDFLHYRLEKAVANDGGKVFLMDMAQIPESMGIDIERWMYYLKDMNIGFINSFEEGKKGFATGQLSKFNQFQAIDLSLAQSINNYISMLDYIKNQVYFVSGVSPQRMSEINNSELVGNVERAVQQSSLITEYLFMAHDEVKRRVYVALLETAKIAYRDGLTTQYALDDMSIELLNILPLEFEDSEFNVFVTNSNKDNQFKEELKMLLNEAMKAQMIGISAVAEALVDDSPRDILRKLQLAEQAMQQSKAQESQLQQQMQQEQLAMQKQIHDEQLVMDQRKLDLEQYAIDTNNETKIQVAEINAMRAIEGPTDMNNNGIPDPAEMASIALEERNIASKMFLEKSKHDMEKGKHDNEMKFKEKELNLKKQIEDKKIKAIQEQNKSQEKIAKDANKLKEKELKVKEQIEKIKLRAAKAKANKPKK